MCSIFLMLQNSIVQDIEIYLYSYSCFSKTELIFLLLAKNEMPSGKMLLNIFITLQSFASLLFRK
jgi:hypothetical protein